METSLINGINGYTKSRTSLINGRNDPAARRRAAKDFA